MTVTLTIFTALLLDAWLGEPRRFHPLVGFGHWAQALERRCYADSRLNGCIALMLAIVPVTGAVAYIAAWSWHWLLDAFLLYLTIGWSSLNLHAKNVKHALLSNELTNAREQVSLIVSRDTSQLDSNGVSRATVESVLENGNDAIFGTIFWFAVAGAPGAVTYRLVNTLDAMWGYRNARYFHFGWSAARLDDVLNYIPARLTAFSYALCGNARKALICWNTQDILWKSPNAGPVMAAGAGSLGLVLGGPARYHGQLESRPLLGMGRTPETQDIDQALRLIRRSLLLWLIAIGMGEWFFEHVSTL